jgi:TolB-like protein/tetratricopeptide (TPR) repeat protein
MKKLFFLITFIVLLFFFASPCTAKQMNILVLPFENTGDKQYSWISAGMTDTVISDLTRIQNISVVSNQDRKKVLEEMKFILSGLAEEDRMIKLGKLTGANVIFTGSYIVSGDRLRVHARLVNVETGRVENSTKIDGTLNGIFDLQDKVVFTLMADTEKITIADIKAVKITEQDRKKIEEKPRPKLTAYEWYAKGLEVQFTNPNEAFTNFKKAVDIDPNYTDALMEAGITAGGLLFRANQGLGYLERAERIFKGRNETQSSGYAMLMKKTGTIYWSDHKLDRALEYYLKSQSIMDGLGLQNTEHYAMLMMEFGVVYDDKGERASFLWSKSHYDRALEYYLKSQSIMDGLGSQNTDRYARLMMNLGVFYTDRRVELDRALEYYLKSKSIHDRLELHSFFYALLMGNMALLYEKQGQRDMAGRHYRMAYDTYARVGSDVTRRDEALKNAERLGY